MTLASGPSLHLTWKELACRDHFRSPYSLDWRDTRGRIVGANFDAVREECSRKVENISGGTITECVLDISEGFRTEAYQAYLRTIPRYKAALHSQHCEGYAIDIACPRLLSFIQFVDCVKRATTHEGSRIQYIEYRPSMNYIHVDGGGRTNTKVMEEVVA